MIAITYTHRDGLSVTPLEITIDQEKIVSLRDRGVYAEIEYGETYDRRRQPIVYQLTAGRAAVKAEITGDILELTVINPVDGTTYDFDLQEKYVVDIREAIIDVAGTLTACRRIEYVPGSFVPKIIFVSASLASLTDSTPTEITTTEEVTTTVAEEATTTVEEATTTVEEVTTTAGE